MTNLFDYAAARDTALATVERNAGPEFIREAQAFVVSHLKTHEPTDGETLTDECKAAGYRPDEWRSQLWRGHGRAVTPRSHRAVRHDHAEERQPHGWEFNLEGEAMSVLDEFREIFAASKPDIDPAIAFDVWIERQPLHGKLQAAHGSTISIRAEDVTRCLKAAYLAGFHRASKP